MTENVLTLERARKAALKIVQERGNTIYSPDGKGMCRYIAITDPDIILTQKAMGVDTTVREHTGCLVGELLDNEDLLTREIAISGESIDEIIESEILKISDNRVTGYLNDLQLQQDGGASWIDAYRFAEMRLVDPDYFDRIF